MAASPGSRVLVVLDDAPFGAMESAGFRPFLVASAPEEHGSSSGVSIRAWCSLH